MSKPNFKDTFPWPPECTSQQQIDYKQILDANRSTLTAFIASEKLPESFYAVMEQHILPLSVWLLMELQGFPYRSHPCPIIGITGAQGSGKTTITSALSMMLGLLGVRCCTLSIDDFYLTKSARQQLYTCTHTCTTRTRTRTRRRTQSCDVHVHIHVHVQVQVRMHGHVQVHIHLRVNMH